MEQFILFNIDTTEDVVIDASVVLLTRLTKYR